MENTSPQQIEGSGIDPWSGSNHGLNHELSWHESLLSGDSRTLALTIPQLPSGLREAVTNASLLCRIAGTIEDDPVLDPETKDGFNSSFLQAVTTGRSADEFAADLAPLPAAA